jgi:protein-S-isoprenylcysteine O-methyltransferase Ste14
LTLTYTALIVLFSHYSKLDVRIHFISYSFLFIIGAILIIVGVSFLIISIITLNKAYKADTLRISGVYSVCRHPLYSSWIILIVPGIVLLLDSWISLTIPIVMYVIFRVLIKQEELFLQNKFGEEYIDYKSKVSLLFPMFWRYEKNK